MIENLHFYSNELFTPQDILALWPLDKGKDLGW